MKSGPGGKVIAAGMVGNVLEWYDFSVYGYFASSMDPDRGQIELFVGALFRHASPQGFVSLRAFYEEDSAKPFRINPTSLAGGLRFLIDVAEDDAGRAANFPKPVVFCPPIAVFGNKERAREQDVVEGLALSVECDQHPYSARAKLETVLGPATLVVCSGGRWTDPATGTAADKLHLHWRLRTPARGEALPRLKQARDLAARYVGGDPSNKAVCHPIRWPGSWHRKAAPVLCTIDTATPDAEVDLETALAALTAVCPPLREKEGNGKDHGAGSDWGTHIQNIISGESYHAPVVALAAKLTCAGADGGATVNLLRGLMAGSNGPRDGRWQTRYEDIPRAVASAEKFGNGGTLGGVLESMCAAEVTMTAVEWFWPNRFALGKLGLVVGLPDEGKGQILAFMAAQATRGGEWPCGEGRAVAGKVVMLGAEDGYGDTVVPRLLAAGADLSRIEIVHMVRDGAKKRMFSLVTDIELLRQKIKETGDVRLVLIDPISAYLGIGKVDSFRTTDVRAVLAPLVELAEGMKVSIVGIMHFNKKVDVTNALLRISDSLAFGATARHVFAVVDDAENKRKLFVRAKNNIATANVPALAYNFGVQEVGGDPITKKAIVAPYILWHAEHVDVSAMEAMQASKSPAARDEAKKFLADLLAGGPMARKDIDEAAKANGISERTLFRAKKELNAIAKRNADDGGWTWQLMERTKRWGGDE